MRHIIHSVIFALAGLLSFSVNAAPVFVDFEDVEPKGTALPGTSFTTKGIVFDWAGKSPSIPAILSSNWAGGSGSEMAFCGYCDLTNGTSLYTANGSVFELDSFRFGGTDGSLSGLPYTGTVTGYLSGGGTVTKSILSAADTSGLIAFDETWVNLTSVDILIDAAVVGRDPFDAFAIDDMSLQAVPVPAAVWLFGSALGGLGWMRRKQAA